jgi:hypothetical protein
MLWAVVLPELRVRQESALRLSRVPLLGRLSALKGGRATPARVILHSGPDCTANRGKISLKQAVPDNDAL